MKNFTVNLCDAILKHSGWLKFLTANQNVLKGAKH